MVKQDILTNQRTHARFRAKKLAFAVMVNSAIMFQLIDISTNGLAFVYIGKEKWFDELPELDLLFYGHDFWLKRFPIISISDFTLEKNGVPMRRHGVMFGNLNSAQQEQLHHFIVAYTDGEA